MNKSRQLATLANKQGLSVMWGSISSELKQKTLPVYIPLRKGLLGYRIGFIRSDRQADFATIKTVVDLKHLNIGQGRGWADVEILHNAGLNVTASDYPLLFNMVEAKRIDYFPRGVNEIFAEYDMHHASNPALSIESHVALHYPNPYYFYVNKDDTVLARRLEQGLWMMIKDGSFNEIFWRYNGNAIKKANLASRQIIEIPTADALTPHNVLEDSRLWYSPVANGLKPGDSKQGKH